MDPPRRFTYPKTIIVVHLLVNNTHNLNVLSSLTSPKDNCVLVSHQLSFCSSSTSQIERSKCCLFILTKLPKKMGILSYLAFTLSHLLQWKVGFFLVSPSSKIFLSLYYCYISTSPIKKMHFLNSLTNCQHESKNLTKIIAVRISSQSS